MFGLGFVGSALALAARERGWAASGTMRDAVSDAAIGLGARGVSVLGFDGTEASPPVAAALRRASHVVLSIPPGPEGDPALLHHGADIAAATGPGWIGYLCTTGVYGNTDGVLVDEDTPPAPSSARAARRVAAEGAWAEFARAHGKRLDIFRLAGIYGPGRSALDDVRAGTARRIIKPGQAFSRVHRDDILAALLLAMASPGAPGETRRFNLCDDNPAPSADVVAEAARLLGVAPPPEIPFAQAAAGMSPMALSFWADNRRVSSARAKAVLGWRPRYPSYREGLAACLRAEAGAAAP
ncbi:MAG: SDR family NAD(P)-dependent oxidoreductase [Alphaproteobacteria bacterium]|nr:SDR family NAD(P)-dependent oxidoreductase [Alphaproteobacteria bacterium]